MNLFQKEDIKLRSGQQSDFKIECDALTDEDIKTLAYLISKKKEFAYVVGVPTGGLRLATALQRYCDPKHTNKILLVDDVLTTGGAMEEEKKKYEASLIEGVVIFARGKCPDWITPVFQMW